MGIVKYALLKDLLEEQNAHLQGVKRVFMSNADSQTSLTQFAYGYLSENQNSGPHLHKSMDEYFYFIRGRGIYVLEEVIIDISPGTFINIPAGVIHNLINDGKEILEFIYFGINTGDHQATRI
jgi:mannose-6-phosphate isomerase-like protein (cupin superfamily)